MKYSWWILSTVVTTVSFVISSLVSSFAGTMCNFSIYNCSEPFLEPYNPFSFSRHRHEQYSDIMTKAVCREAKKIMDCPKLYHVALALWIIFRSSKHYTSGDRNVRSGIPQENLGMREEMMVYSNVSHPLQPDSIAQQSPFNILRNPFECFIVWGKEGDHSTCCREIVTYYLSDHIYVSHQCCTTIVVHYQLKKTAAIVHCLFGILMLAHY